MAKVLLEICCGSAEDAIVAAGHGADRVELNNNLFQGGLTPSIGTLQVVKAHTDIPVMTMVRIFLCPLVGALMLPLLSV